MAELIERPAARDPDKDLEMAYRSFFTAFVGATIFMGLLFVLGGCAFDLRGSAKDSELKTSGSITTSPAVGKPIVDPKESAAALKPAVEPEQLSLFESYFGKSKQ